MIAIPVVLVAWLGWAGFVAIVGTHLTEDGSPAKTTCTTNEISDQKIQKTCIKEPYSPEDK